MFRHSRLDLLVADARRPPGREITTPDERWRVYERPPELYDRRQAPSLVFESRTAIRRVREYPHDWMALSDEELLRLSWRR